MSDDDDYDLSDDDDDYFVQDDEYYLRECFKEAREARSRGNHPFGAILVDKEGIIQASAGNGVRTELDRTAHVR